MGTCARGWLLGLGMVLALPGTSAEASELLGERQFSLVGANGANASPATGFELLLRITDASIGDGPMLFEGTAWTQADVGATAVVDAGSDPDFDAAAAALSDGAVNYLAFQMEILPDLGGPGFAESEAQFFGLGSGEDLHGSSVEAIALRLDSVEIVGNQVAATLTLSVYGSPVLVSCQDEDGDGFGSPGDASCELGSLSDCNDYDSAIFPGAFELCDGMDNDCDGAPAAGETDWDGDGFAPCEGDCDDGDAYIHPDAVELPGNGLDENCDGSLGACDPGAFDNHGQFVRCVVAEVNSLVDAGWISEDEGNALIRAAAHSDAGR